MRLHSPLTGMNRRERRAAAARGELTLSIQSFRLTCGKCGASVDHAITLVNLATGQEAEGFAYACSAHVHELAIELGNRFREDLPEGTTMEINHEPPPPAPKG